MRTTVRLDDELLHRAKAYAPKLRANRPGPSHWSIFVRLCEQANVTGNLVSDAYLAAVAIESGCEWITTDRDFARFPGLRWRHPLDL